MSILYDHQMFSIQKYGGITRYFCELMKNINIDYELSLLFSDNYYLSKDRKHFKKINILPDADFKGKDTLQRKIYALNQYYSRKRLSKGRYDVFHPTFYDDYFINIVKKPYVITVHDLIEYKFPSNNARSVRIRKQMDAVIRNAARVIAISEHTRHDVQEFFGIASDKIDVIYHGHSIVHGSAVNNWGEYILFVGHRKAYKNFAFCLKAIAPLLKKERDMKLVCIGQPFSKEEAELISGLNLSGKVVSYTADDEQLNNLYAHALSFIYPSLYEGFGMPILEAFANGCPVCLSNSSCFPEIAGNAGVYFDPGNAESILDAVERIIYNPEMSTALKVSGAKRLKEFSWAKTASQTIDTYKKASRQD